MSKNLELAAFNLQSALLGAQKNVDRIEFCNNYTLGGITPKIEDFLVLRKAYDGPIYVMIRPRGGDFVYSFSEIEKMKKSITEFLNQGADGFVFGVLDYENQVDIEINLQLIQECHNKPTTFHRAFDRTPNPFVSLEKVIQCGFNNILSSGGQLSVLEGAELLNELKINAKESINFVAGGGVRSQNIRSIMDGINTTFYHSSAMINQSEIADENEIEMLVHLVKTYDHES